MDSSASPKVLVMMATYNGARYVREQIESILVQQNVDVTLLISDDDSSDDTVALCREYEASGCPVHVKVNIPRLGVGMNFMSMVYGADADAYDVFAFSDQDDFWLPDKLLIAIEAINSFKSSSDAKRVPGYGTPILYCSDLLNVDENLENPKAELASLSIDTSKRATPLIRNWYSGCTMVFNSDMVRLLQRKQYESFARIHDAWVAMIATYCGNLLVDLGHHEILRRNSGHNVVGALHKGKDFETSSIAHLSVEATHACREAAIRMAQDYGDLLSEADRALVVSFSSYNCSLFAKINWAFSSEYKALTWPETLLMRIKFLADRY